MIELNTGTIAEDKQMRLQKDLALLASLKTKASSLPPKASASLFYDPVESVNMFNTNLSFHSIDKGMNRYGLTDSIGANIQNENINANKTNLSFSLFPFHFMHDTILSFTLDTPKEMDQYFPIHKTNESFVYSINPLPNNSSISKIEKEQQQQQPKEDSLMSTQKQTTQAEMTLVQDYEIEPVIVVNNNRNSNRNSNNSNYKARENGTRPECLHQTCDFVFRTFKQELAHHHKMSPECKKDTILLLTSIKRLKQLLKVIKKKKKLHVTGITYKYLLTKFEQIMRDLSLSEHVELLTGYSIENEL